MRYQHFVKKKIPLLQKDLEHSKTWIYCIYDQKNTFILALHNE